MLSIDRNIVLTDKQLADLFRYIDFKARYTSRSNPFVLLNEQYIDKEIKSLVKEAWGSLQFVCYYATEKSNMYVHIMETYYSQKTLQTNCKVKNNCLNWPCISKCSVFVARASSLSILRLNTVFCILLKQSQLCTWKQLRREQQCELLLVRSLW